MKWREMRKKERQLSTENVEEFLLENNVGHLGTFNPDGSPYVVPINYAYKNGAFLLHCAKQGHKLENLRNNHKICFEVSRHYSTNKSEHSCSSWVVKYKSVIAFGRAVFPKEDAKRKLLQDFTSFYTDQEVSLSEEGVKRTCVIVLEVEHMTGKISE